MRIPVEIVASPDEAVEPLRDEELPQPMREFLHVNASRIAERGDSPPGLAVFAILDRSQDNALENVGLGLTLDVLKDGIVAASARMPPHPLFSAEKGYYGSAANARVDLDTWRDPADTAGWELRLRGSAKVAVLDLDCSTYWSGELTVALADVLSP